MKITLKSFKHSPSLSEETIAFTANIYADGKLVGHASNRGHGGNTDCFPANNKREEFQKVVQFCLTLPEKDYGDFTLPSDIERVVDDLVDEMLEAKEKKSFETKCKKAMLTGIVFKQKNEVDSYSVITFKNKLTIADLLKTTQGINALTKAVIDIKAKGRGIEILNTNLPSSVLKSKKK